ncbi:hypothetical protein DCC81_19240 [Chitinophaga parva]|uniref:Arm DNA-binding domain-containing protein n=1 Tax=Chitinophaga parva TaxID=2169414 RepID=A0A2T7BJ91_9BACT|nr:Arm DNA-binding domain-containing protein [Chitinophaga parva]PUZ26356.1 hypothetical protein DCC81_19240 [Chitinophaga parva]
MNILSVDYSFWLYKSKVNKRGEVPVYMRIAVGDSKKEIATGIYIKERDWNASRRVIRRSSADYEIENLKLEILVKRFKEVVKMLVENEHDFTADLIKQRMLNENKQVKGLLPYFEGYLEKMKSLVGIEFAVHVCHHLLRR